MDLLKEFISTMFHTLILFLGGILVLKMLKAPKTIMLVNRLIIMGWITYKLYNIISYGR